LCKFGEYICYSSRDIELFLIGYFFGALSQQTELALLILTTDVSDEEVFMLASDMIVLCSVIPRPPTSLAVTDVEATRVRLQFIPGFSGHTYISWWFVEAQKDYVDSWSSVYNVSARDAVSLIVENLQPDTAHRLRVTAVNIAGQSSPSQPSAWFNTLQAIPSNPPTRLIVRPVSHTALHVQWLVG